MERHGLNVNEINAPSPILSSGPPISYDEKYDANNAYCF